MRWRASIAAVAGAAAAVAVIAAAVGYAGIQQRQSDRKAAEVTGGDPARGRHLMRDFGCAGCHQIPGITAARGQVGPPLRGISQRVYVGGVLPNTPDNLVQWILHPRAHSPRSAMPVTGIDEKGARDVAAYLYGRT